MSMVKLSPTRGLPRPDRAVGRRVEERVKPFVRWGLGHGLPRLVIRKADRKDDLQGRLIMTSTGSHTFDVVPHFDELRRRGPVVKGAFSYMSGSHPLVRDVLGGSDFRTGIGTGAGGWTDRLYGWAATELFSPVEPPSLLVTEPPDHTRYRKLVTRVFTARAVEGLRERAQQVADELLDAIDPRDPVDLVEAYCGLLPVTVISEILGVPTAERTRILELGAGAAASLDLGLSWRQFRDVEASLHEFDAWLTDHLEDLRRQPGDNLLSQLIAVRDEEGGLSELELKATAGLVLAAGFETTVNLLSNGIALLCEHPDQLALLRERPELWGNAVDEALRFDPPVLLTGRVAERETELAGVRIPAGAVVTTVLAAANRDPDVFADPGRFDVTRENARDHVSFSSGRHYCLGASLARMEGEIGLRTLFDRFPDLALRPGATRRPTRILRGYETLPASLRG
ncbi:cytochrome P450 [Nocardioides sp. KR10-350]|uniref:cytochrome P450 n=1 Tax=Nocardioides cheoyonin TaxID=3156615 RepID=UPI0032B62A0A